MHMYCNIAIFFPGIPELFSVHRMGHAQGINQVCTVNESLKLLHNLHRSWISINKLIYVFDAAYRDENDGKVYEGISNSVLNAQFE